MEAELRCLFQTISHLLGRKEAVLSSTEVYESRIWVFELTSSTLAFKKKSILMKS